MFSWVSSRSEDAYWATLGLGTKRRVAGCPQPSRGAFAAGSVVLWPRGLLPPATAGQRGASRSGQRWHVGLCAWATEMIRYNFLTTVSVTLTVTAWACVWDCPFMALSNVSFHYPKLITRMYWHLYVIFGPDKCRGGKIYLQVCREMCLEFVTCVCILQRVWLSRCNYVVHQLAPACGAHLPPCWIWRPGH